MGGIGKLQYLLAALQVGLAIAVLVVVRQELWYEVFTPSTTTCYVNWYGRSVCYGDWVCLMTTSTTNICYYAWAVAALSLALSVVLVIAQAFRGRFGGRGCVCTSAITALIGLGWWIAAGVVITDNAKDADKSTIPVLQDTKDSRTAVYAMAWAEVGLFFFSTLVALADCRSAPSQQQQQQQAYPQGAYVSSGYGAPPPPAYQQPYGAPPAYGYPQPPPPAGYPVGAQYGAAAYPPPPPPAAGYAATPPYPPPMGAASSSAEPPKVV